MLLITLTMALFYSSFSVSHDNVTVSDFPTVSSVKRAYSLGPTHRYPCKDKQSDAGGHPKQAVA